MKRPVIAVTVFYCLGILLGDLPIPLPGLFALAFLMAFIFPFTKHGGKILLWSLVLLTGWIGEAQRTQIISPFDLRNILPTGGELAVIRGTLEETPRHHAHEIRNREMWSSSARIKVSQIKIANRQWQPAFGSVMCQTREFLPEDFFEGQQVEISGVLMRPEKPIAEGHFDYGTFLEQQGIYHEFITTKKGDWKLIFGPAKPPVTDRFRRWARETLALGLPARDLTLQLEWALTLGWKEPLTEEVSEPFMRASTFHIFAVDGLRIAILAGIFMFIFRRLRLNRITCALLIIPVILFYGALTGWPASAVRAIVMLGVVFGGWIFKRPDDLINSLFVAAMAILIWEPRQMY